MADQWIVLLQTGTDVIPYGPMPAREAEEFAEWLTHAVDPAVPRLLRSPVGEMLAWWRSEYDRNECTHGDGCQVHPDVQGLHNLFTTEKEMAQ